MDEKKQAFLKELAENPIETDTFIKQSFITSQNQMPKFRPNALSKLLARERKARILNSANYAHHLKILNNDGNLDMEIFEDGIDIKPLPKEKTENIYISFAPSKSNQYEFQNDPWQSDEDSSDLPENEREGIDYPSEGIDEEENSTEDNNDEFVKDFFDSDDSQNSQFSSDDVISTGD